MLDPRSSSPQTDIPKNNKLLFSAYLTLFLALVYWFIHIPLTTAGTPEEVYFRYYYHFNESATIFELENQSKNSDQIILHTNMPLLNKKNIFFLDSSGLVKSIYIPLQKGYLTYPNDGSFFIWYPKLGSKIKVFDSLGKFLWEVPENRYLQALDNNTNHILAFSGDGSRVEFLKPDFSSVLEFEGFLLVSHQTSKSPSKEFDACFAFLNGDIILVNTRERKQFRISLNHPLKSIGCNFEKNYFLAQIQKKVKLKEESNPSKERETDVLIKVPFDSISYSGQNSTNQFSTDIEFTFPKNYPFSLPIHWQGNDHLVMLPVTNEDMEIWLISDDGQIKAKFKWPQKFANATEIENFRIDRLKNFLILSNDSMIMILSKEGVSFKHEFNYIHRISYKNDLLLVQTPEGIMAFEISLN